MSDDTTPPNIVCFVMDQLRYDHLGYSGNAVIETPNIDSIAQTGAAFNRTYVANPLCQPSRASLFSGRMPRNHGVRTNGIPLNEDIPILPQVLQKNGYNTSAIGKIHFKNFMLPNGLDAAGVDPMEHPEAEELWLADEISSLPEPYYGFEKTQFIGGHADWVWGDYVHWLQTSKPEAYERLSRDHPNNRLREAPDAFHWTLPEEAHYNRWIANNSIEFLNSATEDDDPFFLYCSFPDPHHPFAAPEPWGSKYDPDSVSLPTRRENELDDLPPHFQDVYENDDALLSGVGYLADKGSAKRTDDEIRDEIATTYGMISFTDQEIGRVLRRIHELGIQDETLIIFLSDHGDMMGDHWMIRKGPFHFEGLVRVPMVWNWRGHIPGGAEINNIASLLDFVPTILDICDLDMPEGDTPPMRQTENELPALPGKSLLDIFSEDAVPRDHVVIENDEDYIGLRLRTYITDRYKLTVYPGKEYGELFDLDEDPDELHNRWDDEAYQDVKKELFGEFLDAYVRQEVPLPRRLSHA